jgi:hypothetical protein
MQALSEAWPDYPDCRVFDPVLGLDLVAGLDLDCPLFGAFSKYLAEYNFGA